ncbi:MAG: aldehyde dehydrogenase family protein [Clostridiales bacterium]
MNKLFINGNWISSSSKETFDVYNPYDGSIYTKVAKASQADAKFAMESAYNARKEWSSTQPNTRSEIIYKVSQLLEEQKDDFINVLAKEGGSTFSKGMFEVMQSIDLLKTASGDCKRIMGKTYHTENSKLSMTILKPKGTVLAISPWNFPLILSLYKIAYALATGNTVVYKPSSETPVSGLKIGKLFEEAGLIPGALNILTGSGKTLGDTLIDDNRCSYITLTGESTTGKHIAKKAANNLKEYTLELGGNNPLVILSDADLDYAVNASAFGAFLHQGQICMSSGRLIVHEKIYDEFSERLAQKAATLKVGDPSIPDTIIGPLINDSQVKKVDSHVKEAQKLGAKVLYGGTFKNRLYQPTVVKDVTNKMNLYSKETFGPIATIIKASDEKDALQIANDSIYGLSAGVITQDIEKALFFADEIESGMIHINNSTIAGDPLCPFGGCKWSGQGREGGEYSIKQFTNIKWVTIQKEKFTFPF